MKLSQIVVFTILFSSFISKSFGQGCCTAGSSTFGGLERGISKQGNIILGVSFISTSLNSTFNGREKISDPLDRTASISSFNIELEYGLSEKVSLLVFGGYVLKHRQTTVRSGTDNSREVISFEGKGIGEVIILGKYEIITPTILSPLGLSFGGGVKLPVGSYTQEVDGSRLAIDLQPGTGSTDVLLWGNFYKGFQPVSLAMFVTTLYRYAGSNLDGYRFGDEYLFSVGSEYYLTDFLTFSLSARGRFSDKDFWGGRFLPSTGGTYYDLLPSIIYAEGLYNLRVFYQTPLYRNVQGIQLTTSSIIGVVLLFNIQ
ncbi:hypothetical protein [Ignavibacterium sp.]|uniref:hypothetical protein n=1 Tax=Ignavibacterium sp. TaxID=2651167 RepID=UPI00307EB278